MEQLVEDLRTAIPAAFETEDYRAQRHQIDAQFAERGNALEELRVRAAKQDLALIQTPDGSIAFAPMRNGTITDPEAFSKLEDEERNRIETSISGFRDELEKIIQQIPKLRQERARKIRELNRRVIHTSVSVLIEELQKEYEKLPDVLKYSRRYKGTSSITLRIFVNPRKASRLLCSECRCRRLKLQRMPCAATA